MTRREIESPIFNFKGKIMYCSRNFGYVECVNLKKSFVLQKKTCKNKISVILVLILPLHQL